MYVVRIENDEALMFRAFRKWAEAKASATSSAQASDVDHMIDIYSVVGLMDPIRAVEAVRDGQGVHITNGEKLLLEDFRDASSFLAGIGLGTGAGF